MSDIDRSEDFKGDPFFEVIHDGEWNATIGRQGDEENYLDGYIEAAIELADAIVEKRLYGKRDTLILPILYNARHATELNIKFAHAKLISTGAVKDNGHGLDHNIAAYWKHMHDSKIGDVKLRSILESLEPFVRSLELIDGDGQELRYHVTRDNKRSLEKFALVNVRLVQHNLRILQKLLSDLKYRTLNFVDECSTGTFTQDCSRRDLLEIAGMLLPRDQWTDPKFDDVRNSIKERFSLGSGKLSAACKKIQETRELAALIGVESQLLYLSDDDVVWVIEQWRRLHPVRAPAAVETGIDYFDVARLEGMQERGQLYREVIESLNDRLDAGKLADLEVMFYLERDRYFSECYEELVSRKLKEHAAAGRPKEEIRHLLEKTTLLQHVRGSAKRLGRIKLADRLSDM